jgi:hypothetical protein
LISDLDQNIFNQTISSERRTEIECRQKCQSDVSENSPRRSRKDSDGELKYQNSQVDHNSPVKFTKLQWHFFIAWAKAPFETFWQRAQAPTNWFQASVHFGYNGERYCAQSNHFGLCLQRPFMRDVTSPVRPPLGSMDSTG